MGPATAFGFFDLGEGRARQRGAWRRRSGRLFLSAYVYRNRIHGGGSVRTPTTTAASVGLPAGPPQQQEGEGGARRGSWIPSDASTGGTARSWREPPGLKPG